MHRWNFWSEDHCPLCLSPEETARHVITCQSEVTRSALSQGLLAFKTKLEKLDTDPDITHCLIEGLSHRHTSFGEYCNVNTLLAALAQDEIGWATTMEVRISYEWQTIQAQHHTRISSRRGPSSWLASVVEGLWELTHLVWTTRCTTIKDMERAEEIHTTRQSLDTRIRSLYSEYAATSYAAEDRYLFEDKTLEQRLAQPRCDKETWIQAVAWADKITEESTLNENNQLRTTMETWLHSSN